MATAGHALEPGATFAGRYRVREPLGRGAMGAVYLVHDEALEVEVALKVLSAAALLGGEAEQRFRREVRLARDITHENVVRIHDIGEAAGVHYYTMQWVEGEGLERAIARDAPLPPHLTASIACQIAKGLAAAHAAGVVHRDLKPSNVMLGRGARVVLTDFGIARSLDAGDPAASLTQGILGSPSYMAPEQVEGGEVTPRTDIYAFGAVLYEMLTGRPPFSGRTPLATALARLKQPPPDPRERVATDEALAELTLRCLARDPVDRPPSADVIVESIARGRTESLQAGSSTRDTGAPVAGGPAEAPPSANAETMPVIGDEKQGTPSRLLAPLLQARSVAVLPFRLVGPPDEQYLGEGLTEELIDLLSRTRNLRVYASGATRMFADDRSIQAVRDELGADLVVDATVRRAGDRVRITARLVDAQSGVQLWSQPFSGRFEDVFALQETMGARIAETLRGELTLRSSDREVPADALEPYLRARQKLRHDFHPDAMKAAQLLEQGLEVAPGLAPALAAHARACVMAWWMARDETWNEQRAVSSVERALESAPHLPETHVAAGMLAAQTGRYGEAVSALHAALDLAPTCVDALIYLGQLECEGGRHRLGLRRLELVHTLDPTRGPALIVIGRARLLQGDVHGYREVLALLDETDFRNDPGRLLFETRISAWIGDLKRMDECIDRMPSKARREWGLELFRRALAGGSDSEQLERAAAALMPTTTNARMISFARQLATEMFCLAGHYELAGEALQRAADAALIDVLWLEGCPLLAPLRELDEYPRWLSAVKRRADQLWRAT